jgi:hypothetical protein
MLLWGLPVVPAWPAACDSSTAVCCAHDSTQRWVDSPAAARAVGTTCRALLWMGIICTCSSGVSRVLASLSHSHSACRGNQQGRCGGWQQVSVLGG